MEHFRNASSIHLDGQSSTAPDRARETMAEFFNCHDAEGGDPNSGGTEGDNTALFGLLRPGDHLHHYVD